MNRRGFLAFLTVAPLTRLAFAAKSTDKDGYTLYKGYRIRWTGYKEAQGNDLLIGQWIAYAPDRKGPHYYACTQGVGGTFHPGEYFDLTLLSDWEHVDGNSTEKHKEEIKWKTYRHLLRIIQ